MNTPDEAGFRDRIGTLDDNGKRNFLHPKKPQGKWYDYRKYVSYLLLACLLSFPFLKVNGNQFLLFNLLERRFNLFGMPFWPQDFYLIVIMMIVGVVFVTLFTVIYGRLFCGWICPQTIFLEMVFRRIEYAIEGDRGAQIRLAKQAWDAEKIRKKGLKWTVFALVSFLIANVFLAYLIGADQLFAMVEHGPSAHWGTFIALIIFTGIFYWVFAWFREQVCIIACPYGRLQGVLLDEQSINVMYDYRRGEGETGRAKIRKGEDRLQSPKGHCIDCNLCVNVCPMGIDIRNGAQLECTNCTACIDECNHMMQSVNLPQGLIRYATEKEIKEGKKFAFTTRMKAYTGVLVALIIGLVVLLNLRSDIETTVMRLPGQTFLQVDGNIRNVYTYRLVNNTVQDYNQLEFKILNHSGEILLVGKPYTTLAAQQTNSGTFFIDIAETQVREERLDLEIGLYYQGQKINTFTARFIGPRKFF